MDDLNMSVNRGNNPLFKKQIHIKENTMSPLLHIYHTLFSYNIIKVNIDAVALILIGIFP